MTSGAATIKFVIDDDKTTPVKMGLSAISRKTLYTFS